MPRANRTLLVDNLRQVVSSLFEVRIEPKGRVEVPARLASLAKLGEGNAAIIESPDVSRVEVERVAEHPSGSAKVARLQQVPSLVVPGGGKTVVQVHCLLVGSPGGIELATFRANYA